ncbi:interleukin-10 receptor subunit beta-like [Hyperolius riggenbachi]|uniref:interleukin-10 receptor subunit beta-like n=1 Tax=Hyperolius riggenbachi TaxID=752182 RepID=UPI0035A30BC1
MYRYLALVLLCLSSPGFGQVPEPVNVNIDSQNFQTFLQWSPPPGFGEEEDVTYTVQYKLNTRRAGIDFSDICVTQDLTCDLSFITYSFIARVKAAVGNSESGWINKAFDPYTETLIGPPDIKASSRSGHIDLIFSGPYIYYPAYTVKEKYGELDYRVEYWKESDPSHVMKLTTNKNTETLSDLDPWTLYCLRVQAYIPGYDKEGQFSSTICENTTDDGRTPWWKLALIFLSMMLFAMLVILGLCFIIYKGYNLHKSLPRYSIPQHLKEFLSMPFYNTPHLPTQPSEDCGESSEQLTSVSVDSEETKEEAPVSA